MNDIEHMQDDLKRARDAVERYEKEQPLTRPDLVQIAMLRLRLAEVGALMTTAVAQMVAASSTSTLVETTRQVARDNKSGMAGIVEAMSREFGTPDGL